MTVIARLDRAIQRKELDSPVEPENDKQTKIYHHTNNRISIFIKIIAPLQELFIADFDTIAVVIRFDQIIPPP
jgi:hypothetical protein